MCGAARHRLERKGAIAVIGAILLIPLLAIVALAVDYGYLLKTRTDLQRAADASALAAVQELIPGPDGSQDLDAVRAVVRDYAQNNMDPSFQVLDSDIEIGRFDPDTIYSGVTMLNSGIYDTVRVTVRFDRDANSPVSLFFSQVMGYDDAEVVATGTAVLQKARYLPPGSDVLPFGVPQDAWENMEPGDEWSIYGDGQITDDEGDSIPGNWGTVDIGESNNSTSNVSDQIVNGLTQDDLDALYQDDRIDTNAYIDGGEPLWVNADTGVSSGMKSAVNEIHGQSRLVPIYDSYGGSLNGNNLEFHVVGWGAVTVVDSYWKGSKQTYIKVKKSYLYDGDLLPNPDLSQTDGVIEGAYTSPVLVE
jgi:hypothetical protein